MTGSSEREDAGNGAAAGVQLVEAGSRGVDALGSGGGPNVRRARSRARSKSICMWRSCGSTPF